MKLCIKTVIFILFLFYGINCMASEPLWENGSFRVFSEGKGLVIFHEQQKMVHIASFAFNFIEPERLLVLKVDEECLTLKLVFYETDGHHDDFPSSIPLSITRENDSLRFYTSHSTFNHITIRLKDQNEHYFGLIEKLYPHNSKIPDLRGNAVDVEVYARGEKDYAENYASAYSAFFISSLGYGSFFDTFGRGRYTLGINGVTEIYHQTGTLDWYLFYGPEGQKIHEQYFQVIGKPKYVPVWACGPVFWRDFNDGGSEQLLNDIRRFTDMEIPLTACYIDRPYSEGGHEWSKMNFNSKFAQPDKWIKKINHEYKMELMTWIGPMTFTDRDFPGLLPNHMSYMDLTDRTALKEFEKRLSENQYAYGVKGHKMDRADEHFPLTARWSEPVDESESRNRYVYLFSKVIDDFLFKAHEREQFNFARAAYHRSQPHLSALWGGDSRNNWHGMSGSMANAIRCGFMGFPVWGSDTGGYLGEGRIDEILYARWLQMSAWSGLFEVKIDGAGGSGEDRPPWKYSERLQKIYKKLSDQRMDLLPYIYSCVNTSYKNGVVMKPLAYVFPKDEKTSTIWNEFIFGNAFLVAPLFSKENSREIYLPQGKWYDFNDLSIVLNGPVTFKKDVPIESVPVYIKGNSIFITGDIHRGNSVQWKRQLKENENLVIHAFPGEEGSGTSFDYLDYHDSDEEKLMSLEHKGDRILFSSDPLASVSELRIRCPFRPVKVMIKGIPVDFHFDDFDKTASIILNKDTGIEVDVVLRGDLAP